MEMIVKKYPGTTAIHDNKAVYGKDGEDHDAN